MNVNELKKSFQNLRDEVLNGVSWLTDNPEDGGGQKIQAKELRRMARNLAGYAEAAARKPGVAVFGASQAGKSTLISALGRGTSGTALQADFNGKFLDFARQINPEGGKETTALVTRLSLDPPPDSPDPDKPLCFKLFSEMDIVKILANTFFADGQGRISENRDEMIQKIDRELNILGNEKNTGERELTQDELEDLEFYLNEYTSNNFYGEILKAEFWKRALPLAGKKLGLEARSKLFSFLWGEVPDFTKLYKTLYNILAELGFPERAYSPLNAIYDSAQDADGQDIGRKYTVLHVDRLNSLFYEETLSGRLGGRADSGPAVEIISETKAKSTVPRPLLCALISEFYIKIKDKPGDFMEKVDFLDFPGYRSRIKLGSGQSWTDSELLHMCFRRGKVAYLFERYRDRRENVALFFCIAKSNQEATDIPPAIAKWIDETHGKTPEERSKQPVSLFVVLTMFDDTLNPDPSRNERDYVTKWKNRLDASLFNFIGDTWLKDWTVSDGRHEPFKNVFWMMNLSYATSYLNVVNKGDEISKVLEAVGIKEEKEGYIKDVFKGYLDCPEVQTYIRDPEKAWDAVLNSPDGGAGYLLKRLDLLLAEPDLYVNQLSHRAKEQTAEIRDKYLEVRCHWHGVNDEQREKKEQLFFDFGLLILEKTNNEDTGERKFGEFLLELQLDYWTCKDIFEQSLKEPKTDPTPNKTAGSAPQGKPNLFRGRLKKAESPEAVQPAAFQHDLANRFRALLEPKWHERLAALVNGGKLEYFGFKDNRLLLEDIFIELKTAAGRLHIFDDIEKEVRKAANFSGAKPDVLAPKLARIAAAELSAFINWMGLSPRKNPDKERRTVPDPDGETHLIFEPPPNPGRFPKIGPTTIDFDQPYYDHWVLALRKLIMDNIGYDDVPYDPEADRRLQAIITKLNDVMGIMP